MNRLSATCALGIIACAAGFPPHSAAAQSSSGTQTQQALRNLQAAIAAQQAQLEDQKKKLADQQAQIEHLQAQLQSAASGSSAAPAVAAVPPPATGPVPHAPASSAPSVAMSGSPRPTITSDDKRYSIAVRALVQVDAAKYSADAEGTPQTDFRRGSVGGTGNRETEAARDFSNGAYFRRARIGVDGTIARDFNYRFVGEFGGAGTEGPTRINDAWINYAGFAPFTIQAGAFSPAANMEDSTPVEDLLFIERATPSELSRTLGGADGRLGIGIRSSGARWMGALTYTSRTVNDAEVFDAQSAVVGRAGFLLATSEDYAIHVGASGTYVLSPPDTGVLAGGARDGIRFRDRPEIRVDSVRLIDTGAINADQAYAAGAEFGANWQNFLFQAENFWYGIKRADSVGLSDPKFSGYYVQGSWIITGERHRYNPAAGSFAAPRPISQFSRNGGIGAWEIAVRYSHTDLDFDAGLAGAAATASSVRGGEQDNWTFGLNWYLNPNLRVLFNYIRVNVDRLNPAGPGNLVPFGAAPLTPPIGAQIGQDLNVYSLRTQFAF